MVKTLVACVLMFAVSTAAFIIMLGLYPTIELYGIMITIAAGAEITK